MLNKLDNSKLRKLKGCPKNGDAVSMVSCWAILFSTIFYIAILFFFNIHISTIINTTKFWFLISNTLILIIAADFGAFFSSTNNEQDLYEDYVRKTHARNVPSFKNHYMKNNTQIETPDERPEEHIKDVVIVEKVVSKDVNLDTNKCKSIKNQPCEENVEKIPKGEKEPKFDRSCYSEERGVMVGDEEKEIVLRRSKSERHAPEADETLRRSKSERHAPEADDTEFSAMSVEELNRRVEEFIRRFNQEIRLEATKDNINSKKLYQVN